MATQVSGQTTYTLVEHPGLGCLCPHLGPTDHGRMVAYFHRLESIMKVLCRDCQCWEDSNHGYGDCHRHAKQTGSWPMTDAMDYCYDGISSAPMDGVAVNNNIQTDTERSDFNDWYDGSNKCVLCASLPIMRHLKQYNSGVCNQNCRFTPDERRERVLWKKIRRL